MSGLFIKEKYGQIPNAILNNSELSLKAKGLWVLYNRNRMAGTFQFNELQHKQNTRNQLLVQV